MSDTGVDPGEAAQSGSTRAPLGGGVERELGVKDDGQPGPLVLITAGLHGNEPAGVGAARRVLSELAGRPTAGRVVALAGNLAALARGERHGGQDLNRLWTEPRLTELLAQDAAADTPDEAELRDLHRIIQDERRRARTAGRDVLLLDLLDSRRLARAIGLPVVLGLEQRIEGPLLTWIVGQGEVGVVIEGGQHVDPRTEDVLADALRTALRYAGVTPPGERGAEEARARIEAIRGDVPPVLDMVYAHPLEAGDGFVMEPGWSNFRAVRSGQALGLQKGEVVQAPIDGYMLMPLYQGLGTEGFFLCEPVGRVWLGASRLVRRLGLEFVLRLLPGVRAVRPAGSGVLCSAGVSRRTEWWLALFGYRTPRPDGGQVLWTRRGNG
jgi:hypothetical protein